MSIKRLFKQAYTALLWTFIGSCLLLTLVFLLLQTPIVKEFLAQKVVAAIAERTDHDIALGQIHISWLDQVVASDVHLYDLQDSTMLKADQVEVNFDLFGLFKGQTLFFDDIVVQGAALNLTRYPEATSINLKEFIDRLSGNKAKGKNRKEGQEIRIGNVELLSTRFVNRNLNAPVRADSLFDFNDLTLQIHEMIINDLSLKGTVLNASILSLKADHATTDLKIEDLQTNLYLDDQHLTLQDLDLRTPSSHIRDSVALSFNHFGNLSQFTDSVQLDIDLEASTLSLLDLRHFAKLPPLDTTLQISMKASGVLSRLGLASFEVGVSSGTMLTGSGIIFGLPDANETFVDLQISNGALIVEDLPNLLGDFDYGGDITFAGDFVGFFRDFVAAANFRTAYGTVNSDINVKIPGSVRNARYTGGLALDGFDLGRVVGEDQLGTVSLVAEVQGAGIAKENIDINMDVKVSEVVYNGYAYDSLIAKGQFKDRFFDGTFQVFDPHCRVGGRADIELTGRAKLDLDIDLDTLHLQELNFASERLDLGGAIAGEIEDLSIDEAGGQLKIENLQIINRRGSEYLPYLTVEASAIEGKKRYEVSAPDFLAKLEGSFLPSALLKDLPAIIESYFLLLTTDRDDLLLEDNLLSHDTTTNYSWELDLQLKDINPYLELLGYPVYVSEDAVVEAEFSRRKNINLSFFAEVDSLKLGPDTFGSNALEVSASRDLASTDVLALIQMSSERQTWDRTAPSSGLTLEWVWFNNTVNSQLRIDQPSLQNSLVLNNQVRYLKDSIIFKIQPSDIMVNGNTWRFDRDNYVSWVDDYMTLHDLEVVSGDQVLYLAGQYAFDSLSSLAFGVENFDLFNLNPFFKRKVEGRMSLQGKFGRIDREDLVLDGKVSVADLAIEGLLAGDLYGETSFDRDEEKVFLDLNLTREGVKTIDLTGYVYPYEEYDQVKMNVDFDQANVDLIQPFLSETFSDIAGSVSGSVNIGGQLSAPTFFGEGSISNGQMKLNLTNSTYFLDGPISFDSYEVAFRGIDIRDDVNGKGKLFGSIYHDNLTNIQVDFLASFKDLRLLNTSARDNDLYYGRIFGTGDLRVSGAASNLALGGEVTTVGNTRVFFPLESTGNAFQEDYILFIDPRAQKGEQSSRPFKDAGFTIDLDLNVTPDAYAELIFDAQKGDIIRGRTEGALQVQLSKSGELSINGGLEIASGAYNFTVPGINKEFQVRRGGTISWSGDPYDGQIDLQATYRQVASLQDWDPSIENSSKIPFLVVLDLEGAMMKPQIDFSIETDEVTVIPGTQADLRRFLLTVNDREDELNRQVFSLLMLRRLSPQNSFQLAEVGRGISSSVSEILSNQLSYWLSQSDENLEVDIDLAGLDQDAFNTFQYRLAYSFFDGRLKVSGGNSFDGPASQESEIPQSNNNLFDNWSVEYLISPDGRLRVKVFSRVNPAFTNTADNFQETGASVQYVQSFNQFRELISRPDSQLKDKSVEPIPQGTPTEDKVSSDF